MEDELTIYCDGGSRGNPGPAASAVVVTKNQKVLFTEGKYLGSVTNNVAEYRAVLMAIQWLVKNQSIISNKSETTLNLDSQLLERQLNGFYKVKNENLKNYFDEIKNLIIKNSLKVKFVWQYRHKNQKADDLVNKVLNENS